MQTRGLLSVITLFWIIGCADTGGNAHADQHGDSTAEGAPEPAQAINGMLQCEPVWVARPLTDEVRETSGLARSVRDTALFWTHNDRGNQPYIFRVAADGRPVSRVRVTAAGLVDWEDIEMARCGTDVCLHIGDIGDNEERRDHITVYRVQEPAAGATSVTAEALHARYPDGPKDAEALFAHGSGDLYIVNKGRSHEIVLYRWPASRAGETVVLERVRVLAARPRTRADRVTAASATPDGRWVGIRTYRTLYVYRADELVGAGDARPRRFDLSPLNEPQGEGLALADDGAVWLSSEAERRWQVPHWSRLQCALPY